MILLNSREIQSSSFTSLPVLHYSPMTKLWEAELKPRILQEVKILFVEDGHPHNIAMFRSGQIAPVACSLSLVGMACPVVVVF